MADSEVSNWWQVGEAPGLKEWCEKNVNDACERLANSVTVMATGEVIDEDPKFTIYSKFFEASLPLKSDGTDYPHSFVSVVDDMVGLLGADAIPWLNAATAVLNAAKDRVS